MAARLLGPLHEKFIPPSFADDPEVLRRARLVTSFGILGSFFGLAYALFYLVLEHYWGASIVVLCSAAVAFVPAILRRTKSLSKAGNLYAFVLLSGFFALCWVEGGMHGHALAWLGSVPLCALLLVDRSAAGRWGIVSLFCVATVVGVEFLGISPPITYRKEWHVLITAIGYLGLVLFMLLLGMIFESGRREAFEKMQLAMAKLEAANMDLTRLNMEKNEFLGIAAHDLKNPLTVVMGLSEHLTMQSLPPEKTLRFAEMISREARRMRELITNLLDLNAIESGKMNFTPRVIELGNLTHRLIENYQKRAEDKQIQILFQPTKPGTIWADESAILQVLENLFSNALKFSPQGKRIFLNLDEKAGIVEWRVRDEGPGISAADQGKLFQRFSKLSARPTGGESSNGLGLSIVRRLVAAMGGTISCESEPGNGASFIVHFPAHRGEGI